MKHISNKSNEELRALGYRVVSRRHRTVSRVDREDWKKWMASQYCLWRPKQGEEWVNDLGASAADFYRRVYSEDRLTVKSIKGIPNSGHDPIGFVSIS